MESIQIRLERLIDRFGSEWSPSKRGNLLSLCLRYACTEMPSEFLNPQQVNSKILEMCPSSEHNQKLLSLLSKLNSSSFIVNKQAVLILLIKCTQKKTNKLAFKSTITPEMAESSPFPGMKSKGKTQDKEASEESQNSDMLFRDILSVYQGIDNLNIIYSRKFDMYILGKDSKLEMTTSAQKMLSSLCEVGWLYRVISLNLNKLMKRRDSLIV